MCVCVWGGEWGQVRGFSHLGPAEDIRRLGACGLHSIAAGVVEGNYLESRTCSSPPRLPPSTRPHTPWGGTARLPALSRAAARCDEPSDAAPEAMHVAVLPNLPLCVGG